jgi:hypothetical protein
LAITNQGVALVGSPGISHTASTQKNTSGQHPHVLVIFSMCVATVILDQSYILDKRALIALIALIAEEYFRVNFF